MLQNNYKSNCNVLVIDSNKEYNNTLSNKLNSIQYKVVQSFDIEAALKSIEDFKDKLDLVILDINTDIEHKIFNKIKQATNLKIILICEHDNYNHRDGYFKQGILDFHIKTSHIDNIIDDIEEALTRLEFNKNEKILIIDDSKVICFTILNILQSKEYQIFTALNAKDGLEIIKEHNISLLILDMELPDMHGIEVMETLRDMYMINNFPILAISGINKPSTYRTVLKKGASDFLKKPFAFEEFILKTDLLIKSGRWQQTIKNQKREIEENLNSFEALVNSTIEGLFIFEKDKCTDINNVALNLLGYEFKKEVLGKSIQEIFISVSSSHMNSLLDISRTEHNFEDSLAHKNGDLIKVQIKEKNIHLQSKDLKIIAIIDISKIKENERLLSNQTKMASMGEMIGNIAHQWRQPLTAISVAAGGIKLGYELDIGDKDENIKELEHIVDNAQFLSDTIETFQNFLKTDKNKHEFEVHKTIEKTIDIIHANLDSHEIHIVKNFDINTTLIGVENDLIQVLLNIINNAIDILKEQSSKLEKYICINTNVVDDFIIIEIQDSALGVPDDIINKIFEPYFTTKHQAQGTGLGLYMTHKIVCDNLNGYISVDNCEFLHNEKQYSGAKFTVKLPLHEI